MSADIVLFLRDRVSHEELNTALSEVFGPDPVENWQRIVHYAEGFATGVGLTVAHASRACEGAALLASRFNTDVLLEPGSAGAAWLLFQPDARSPLPAVPVELRHGLTVAVRKRRNAPGIRAVYA